MFNNNQVGILHVPNPLTIAGDSWMLGSAGLQSLILLDKLYVNKAKDVMGDKSVYIVRNLHGEKVYSVLDNTDESQYSDGLMAISVYDSLNQECLRIRRDEVCCPGVCCMQGIFWGCCCCSGKDARIETPAGQILGYIKPNCDRTKFTCTDEKNNPIMEIRGTSRCFCALVAQGCCGLVNDLNISYLDTSSEPGKIHRFITENNKTDIKVQVENIPPNLSLNSRAILLGVLFYIKYGQVYMKQAERRRYR